MGAAELVGELDVRVAAELTRARDLASFFYRSLAAPLEKGARLVLVFVAAPLLGAAAFGSYQFAGTVTSVLASCTELGLGMRTTRALARSSGPASQVIATGLRLKAATAVPFALLVLVATLTERDAHAKEAMLALGGAALASSFVDYFGAVLRGREDFRHEAGMNALRAALTTGGALVGLFVSRSVLGLSLGLLVGATVSTGVGLALMMRRYDEGGHDRVARREEPSSVLREAIPLWVSGLLATLYFRSDIVIVRYFAGDAEVGAYAAAYRIFEGTMLVPAAIMAVVFPRLAREGDRGSEPSKLERKLVLLMLVLGLATLGVLLALDEPLVRLLLGKSFERSAASLRVLGYTVPVMFVSYAVSYFVIARGRERGFISVLGLMLVLNVALNLVLVPRLGGVGAAWSTLITEAALVVGACALIARRAGAAASPPRLD
jgi:O-antigen/teichoic acid export membrane protein